MLTTRRGRARARAPSATRAARSRPRRRPARRGRARSRAHVLGSAPGSCCVAHSSIAPTSHEPVLWLWPSTAAAVALRRQVGAALPRPPAAAPAVVLAHDGRARARPDPGAEQPSVRWGHGCERHRGRVGPDRSSPARVRNDERVGRGDDRGARGAQADQAVRGLVLPVRAARVDRARGAGRRLRVRRVRAVRAGTHKKSLPLAEAPPQRPARSPRAARAGSCPGSRTAARAAPAAAAAAASRACRRPRRVRVRRRAYGGAPGRRVLPREPARRARVRAWVAFAAERVIPHYYRCLMAPDARARRPSARCSTACWSSRLRWTPSRRAAAPSSSATSSRCSRSRCCRGARVASSRASPRSASAEPPRSPSPRAPFAQVAALARRAQGVPRLRSAGADADAGAAADPAPRGARPAARVGRGAAERARDDRRPRGSANSIGYAENTATSNCAQTVRAAAGARGGRRRGAARRRRRSSRRPALGLLLITPRRGRRGATRRARARQKAR